MLSSINQHAVLVVDGHKSRYDPETATVLHGADIDLAILPAHSSHILQPLDLRLNGLVEDEFREAITHQLPSVLLEFVASKPTPPPQKRSRESDENAEPNQELSGYVKAEYDRLHVLNAIRTAVPRALTPDNILSAWRTSHLYPFQKGNPPYSPKKEEEKRREMEQSAILMKTYPVVQTDGRKTGVLTRRITGVINSSENLPLMTELLTHDLEPEPCEGTCDIMVGEGPVTALIHGSCEDSDVGDTVQILPGPDSMSHHVVGVSDALCFVSIDQNDL